MENITKFIAIGFGGACGALLRHFINVSPLQGWLAPFPLPTFLINITGSFLIGLCFVLLTEKFDVPDYFRLMIMVGFLGAFTTFSTFELETFNLIRIKHLITVIFYVFFSLLLGYIGVIAGIWLGRKI